MKLDQYDLQQALRRLPVELKKLMESDEWENQIFVGGGYLRAVVAGETVNDIDVFVNSKKEAELLAMKLGKPGDVATTDNAFTVKRSHGVPIQIIHRWVFKMAEDVARSFDFTVCCAVISHNNADGWDSYCDDRFYTDLASKRLVYRCPERNEDAGGSMIRVLKYYQKGYRIPLSSLACVIARLMRDVDLLRIEGGLKNKREIAHIIRGLLIEVDPNGIHPDEQ